MLKLLNKEFKLCLHPTAPLMLLLSALILIPNYPYGVSFFYLTLGLFFCCLSARENHDATFTLTLPVSRRELVLGRILFAGCLQLIQLAFSGGMIALHNLLLPGVPNQAGLDASIALIGEGFIIYGIFNAVFFPELYKDLRKVGGPFLKASVALFAYMMLSIVATYAVPFVRDALDAPGTAHMGEKLAFAVIGAAIYAGLTFLSMERSSRRFERLDLQL